MARRSSLLLLVALIQLLGPSRVGAQRTLSGAVRDAGGSVLPGVSVRATILRGPLSALLNPNGPPAATCTMRVLPVDPSIDEKMLKEPDTTKNYTIRVVPPPCQASHPAQAR